MQLLRVNSNNELVVPPFECAWLSDETLQLEEEAGCIAFEVKGETDAAVIFKPTPGSKRWQHIAREGSNAEAQQLTTEDNYCVILGSHRNSSLKVEKCGIQCAMVQNVQEFQLSATKFQRFWIRFDHGAFSIGTGLPGSPSLFSWKDPSPTAGTRHIGLAAWDKFVAYRNIRMHTAACCSTEAQAHDRSAGHVASLEELCRQQVLADLSAESVCAGLHVAHLIDPTLDDLAAPLLTFLAKHLDTILDQQKDDFVALPLAVFVALLKNPSLVCPELRLLEAVTLWAQHQDVQAEQRVNALSQLLPFIRFPLMSPEELQAVQSSPLGELALMKELLAEALESHGCSTTGAVELPPPLRAAIAVESKRHVRGTGGADSVAAARFQRRLSPAATPLMYMCNGDNNGVCYYIGTAYGQQKFVNPALSGHLQVTASSPSCRSTDPKAVVSGNFLRNNAASQQRDGGTWWRMDLGAQHRLMCNYYTMRHDASPDYPRNWALQASNDGTVWVDLRQHVDDCTINMAGQYASWPVTGHAARRPFRFFQLLLLPLAASSSRASSRVFPLSYLEFYGYFFKDPPAY
ncbi:g6184 [Coccomyxa elongata]